MKSTVLRALAVLSMTLAVPAAAQAADYPSRPITFVVPFSAGSATDQLGRALAKGITEQTGKAVIVEDKPGGEAMIGAQEVAHAAPDGYRVLITTNTTHAADQYLFKHIPFDPVKDFSPITLLGKGWLVMVVNPKLGVHSVKDFVELARKSPGKLTFGSGSSSSRVAGELLQQMAGIKILNVPYKSNPMAITDLLGGQIDMMVTDTATGLPQAKSGKLLALGVTGPKAMSLAPGVPTIAEAGVPGYEMGYWFAAYAPARTPQAVIDTLHQMLVNAMQSDAVKQFYAITGTDPSASTPAELAAFQKSESQKWKEIIAKAGIQPE